MKEIIHLEHGGTVALYRDWLPVNTATANMLALSSEVQWNQSPIKMYGKTVMQPRLTAWFGDAPYTYSGRENLPSPWTSTLRTLQTKLQAEALIFNSALCNLYRDGKDSIGMHSDNERELGKNPIIASISLGSPRRFRIQSTVNEHKEELILTHGSLLVMSGTMQYFYKHGVPKEPKIHTPRINITFRNIIT